KIGRSGIPIELEQPRNARLTVFACGRLIGERTVEVSIAEDDLATLEARFNLALEMVHAIGGEEQCHGFHPRRAPSIGGRYDQTPPKRLPDEDTDGAVARLARQMHGTPLFAEPRRETLGLRRGSRAIDPLKDDEGALWAHSSSSSSQSEPNFSVMPSMV